MAGINPATGKYDPNYNPTVKGGPSKDKMAPVPKSEEEQDREEYEKQFGKIGIGNQAKFADWRKKKRGGKISDLAK